MIPLSQILGNVRSRHEAESSIRWKDADIITAINEGLDDLSEVSRFYERHVSIPAANRRTYYDLRGWLPETALGVIAVWSSVIDDWLLPCSIHELRQRWEQSYGPSRQFFMRGAYWMGVWPRPETTAGYLRVYFAGLAPHYTHPQSVIRELPDDFVTALEDYALYDLAAQDAETDRALMHFVDYASRGAELAKFVERRASTARIIKFGRKG